MRKILHIFYAAVFALTGCQAESELPGFDAARWRTDPMGCRNQRAEQIETFLKTVKPYLLEHALGEMQVRRLLGKADAIEIAERGMKFYKYYFRKGRQCLGSTDSRHGDYIRIRFDALNRVNEISLITPDA